MDIAAFISERFVITVETVQERRKLFQILFQRTDGSLFVAFPYYAKTRGLLTLATLRAKTKYPASLSLIDGGKVTGHRVKYSHHPDGAVHFSQDRKILTMVRKQSVRLSEQEGHIFTVLVQGLKDFQGLKQKEMKPLLTDKKTILNYKFDPGQPEALKFVGHWYKESSFVNRILKVGNRPWVTCKKSDNSIVQGLIISDPFLNSDGNHYLLLTCEGIPMLDKDRYSTLIFMGGFDQKEIALNHELDTQFLTLAYPSTGSYEELLRQIGTVDYIESNLL
ncbi:MAG: hypothetical protein FJ004_04180 [Chloroflexi bacterium]|nr:hypothetical protein [Chloroflexota bacterium]